jgi:hypothetical protein
MMNVKPKQNTKKEQKEIKTNPFVHHQPKEKEWKDASKDVFVVPPHLRK